MKGKEQERQPPEKKSLDPSVLLRPPESQQPEQVHGDQGASEGKPQSERPSPSQEK